MAGIAHAAVGLAVKPLAPEIHAGWLILAAMALDILWVAFWAVGLETSPAYHGPAAGWPRSGPRAKAGCPVSARFWQTWDTTEPTRRDFYRNPIPTRPFSPVR